MNVQSLDSPLRLSESGFTLVELLMSMAIVGILSASALFKYQDYRMKTEDMSHEQYFKMARKALEGRNESITTVAAGSYRYAYQLRNSDTWTIANMSNRDDLIPGMPNVPAWMYFYIAEYNCVGQASSCSTQYIYSEDCRTGMIYYFNERKGGGYFDLSWYSSAVDAYC